jgi:hypothetical protein
MLPISYHTISYGQLGVSMTQPPLYKYLDVNGAELTLKNKCLKHAKPSEFNDTEDLTIRSIFPEDDETALRQLEIGFVDVLQAYQ